MFYRLLKDGQLVENYNAEVEAGHEDSDKDALAHAKEVGATEVVTSDGRKVL